MPAANPDRDRGRGRARGRGSGGRGRGAGGGSGAAAAAAQWQALQVLLEAAASGTADAGRRLSRLADLRTLMLQPDTRPALLAQGAVLIRMLAAVLAQPNAQTQTPIKLAAARALGTAAAVLGQFSPLVIDGLQQTDFHLHNPESPLV